MSIYNFATRIEYGEFAIAARETVAALTGCHVSQIYVELSGGLTAKVSGNNHFYHIALPSMDPDRIITPVLAKRILGFVLHEIAHIRFTDMGQNPKSVAYQQKIDAGRFGSLFNALEDYSIENAATDPTKPLAGNVGALLGSLNDDLYGVDLTYDPKKLLPSVETYICQNINRHGRQNTPVLDDMRAKGRLLALPQDIQELVDKTLDQIERYPGQQRTANRLHIAVQLFKHLEKAQAQQPQPQQDQQGDPQDNDAGQQRQGKGKGDGKGKDKPQDDKAEPQDANEGEGQGSGDQSDEGETEGDEAQSGDGTIDGGEGGSGGAGRGAGEGDGSQAKAKAIGDAMPNVDAKEQRKALQAKVIPATEIDVSADATKQRQCMPKIGFQNGYLSTKLPLFNVRKLADAARRGLKSVETITKQRRLKEGRLDRRSLARIPVGATDVMNRRTITEGITTSVTIMVDRSGSMSATVNVGNDVLQRITACMVVAAAIAPAIERAGADCKISLFDDNLITVHQWGKRFQQAEWLNKFGDAASCGGTPMTDKVVWSTRDILKQRTKRRVVIWLLDGDPTDEASTVAEIKRAERKGVEHVGIGIQCDVSRLFGKGKSVRIDRPKDLPEAFLSVLLGKAKNEPA